MRKLRSNEIKWFAKDYKASKWQVQDLYPQRLAPEHALLTTAIHKVPRGHMWPLMKIFFISWINLAQAECEFGWGNWLALGLTPTSYTVSFADSKVI